MPSEQCADGASKRKPRVTVNDRCRRTIFVKLRNVRELLALIRKGAQMDSVVFRKLPDLMECPDLFSFVRWVRNTMGKI